MSHPKLFHLLHQAHHAVFKTAERLLQDELGVSAVQQGALFFIGAYEGCSMSDLAKGLSLNNSAVTGLSGRMEKAGLIERRADPKDGRAGRLYLSAKGKRIRKAAVPFVQEQNARIAAPFSTEELDVITRFLTHLISEGVAPSTALSKEHHETKDQKQ